MLYIPAYQYSTLVLKLITFAYSLIEPRRFQNLKDKYYLRHFTSLSFNRCLHIAMIHLKPKFKIEPNNSEREAFKLATKIKIIHLSYVEYFKKLFVLRD